MVETNQSLAVEPDIVASKGRTCVRKVDRSQIAILTLFALFWAAENFLVQRVAFDISPSYHHPIAYPAIRFGLNLCFAMAVLLLVKRPWVIVLIALDFCISSVVLAYGWYFHEPLPIQAMWAAREGARVAHIGIGVVPPGIWMALLAACGLKIAGFRFIREVPWRVRLPGAALSLASACAAVVVVQFGSYNLRSVGNIRGASIAFVYGYPMTWAAQYFFGPNMAEMATRIYRLRGESPDRLTSVEPPWPVGDHIAVVQLESFGWNVFKFEIQGQPVTPFLNELAEKSRVFRIQAYHSAGSADMDFAVLSGGAPEPQIINYVVPGIAYSNSLPAVMQRSGFRTVSLHGNAGSFFNRRPNLNRMGFDEVWFKDEFKTNVMKRSAWGIRDSELFRFSSEKMKEPGRAFHFIITLDSHAPFDLIDAAEKELFPQTRDWKENYFNSMRALDHAVQGYVESLPEGTIVILYGDHTANLIYGAFHSAREGPNEYVPCLVYCKGNSEWLPTPNLPVTDRPDLRILDVVNFLRHQIALRADRQH